MSGNLKISSESQGKVREFLQNSDREKSGKFFENNEMQPRYFTFYSFSGR